MNAHPSLLGASLYDIFGASQSSKGGIFKLIYRQERDTWRGELSDAWDLGIGVSVLSWAHCFINSNVLGCSLLLGFLLS